MKINRNNYEAFFLDYSEGNLSQSEMKMVELFLSQNPDLELELDIDLPKIKGEKLPSFSISGLSKDLVWNEKEVSELIINSIENQQEQHDNSRLKQFKSAFPSEFSNLEKLLKATILTARNEALESSFKNSLKQISFTDLNGLMIARAEGDLTTSQSSELDAALKSNPENEKELSYFLATKLKASDVNLPSAFKNDLKRKSVVIIPLWLKRASAVAAVLFAFFLPFNFSNNETASEFLPRNSEFAYLDESYDLTKEDRIISFSVNLEQHSKPSVIVSKNDGSSTSGLGKVKEVPRKTKPKFVGNVDIVLASLDSGIRLDRKIKGELISLKTDRLPVSDSNAEQEPTTEIVAVTPVELARRELEKMAKSNDVNNNATVAAVNKTVKKIIGKKSDVIVLEKSKDKSDKGFKFRLGKLLIESTK